jgi:hypothetical protein
MGGSLRVAPAGPERLRWLVDSSFVFDETRSGIMAEWRQAVELAMTDEGIAALMALSRSRTEPASRVSRDVDPLNGEEVANLVEQLSRAPPKPLPACARRLSIASCHTFCDGTRPPK